MEFSGGNQNSNNNGKRSGVIAFILLFLVMTIIAVAMYFKSQGMEIKNISVTAFFENIMGSNEVVLNDVDRDFEIIYEIKEHPEFMVYKDLLIKCTGEYLIALNKKGNEQWKIPILVTKPIIKSAGQDMLVADLGGRNLYVINDKSIKWNVKTTADILNADISDKGYVTVVQKQEGYKAKVITYDPNGIDIFERNIVESFVVSAMVNSSGKQVLINLLDTSGVNATTTLEFTDIFGKPFAAKVVRQNELFPSVWYLDDDSVVAVGGNFIDFLDKDRNLKWEKEYESILSTNVLQNKHIAVASETRAGSLVEIFNRSGQKMAEFIPQGKVIDLSAYSDMLAVNTGREVYFINSRGKLMGKYSAKADIINVYFFNKLEAVIVTKANVVIFNMGG